MGLDSVMFFKGAEKYSGYYAQKGPQAYNMDKGVFERNLAKTQEYCENHGINQALAPIFAGTRFVKLPGTELEKPYPSLQDDFMNGSASLGKTQSYHDIRYNELLKQYGLA